MNNLPAPDLDNTAFFFDIDGTLLDIAGVPEAVFVPPKLQRDLEQLRRRCGGALALVSGRTMADIDRLFSPLKFAAAGAHGTQVRPSPGADVSHLNRPIPFALRTQFTALADRPGMFIEDKEVTLALHYRLANEDLSPSRIAELAGVAAVAGFSLLHGKKVLELKPTGADKGAALRSLMAGGPFQGRRPLFAGDDVTDGYAFAVLSDLDGIGVSVGRAFPGADYQADTPAQLREWVGGLAQGGD